MKLSRVASGKFRFRAKMAVHLMRDAVGLVLFGREELLLNGNVTDGESAIE